MCHLRELIFNSGFGRFVLFNFDYKQSNEHVQTCVKPILTKVNNLVLQVCPRRDEVSAIPPAKQSNEMTPATVASLAIAPPEKPVDAANASQSVEISAPAPPLAPLPSPPLSPPPLPPQDVEVPLVAIAPIAPPGKLVQPQAASQSVKISAPAPPLAPLPSPPLPLAPLPAAAELLQSSSKPQSKSHHSKADASLEFAQKREEISKQHARINKEYWAKNPPRTRTSVTNMEQRGTERPPLTHTSVTNKAQCSTNPPARASCIAATSSDAYSERFQNWYRFIGKKQGAAEQDGNPSAIPVAQGQTCRGVKDETAHATAATATSRNNSVITLFVESMNQTQFGIQTFH